MIPSYNNLNLIKMEGGAEAKKEEEVKDEKKVRWPDFNAGVDFDRRRF